MREKGRESREGRGRRSQVARPRLQVVLQGLLGAADPLDGRIVRIIHALQGQQAVVQSHTSATAQQSAADQGLAGLWRQACKAHH